MTDPADLAAALGATTIRTVNLADIRRRLDARCHHCDKPFTTVEWEDRHGDDTHARCCTREECQ